MVSGAPVAEVVFGLCGSRVPCAKQAKGMANRAKMRNSKGQRVSMWERDWLSAENEFCCLSTGSPRNAALRCMFMQTLSHNGIVEPDIAVPNATAHGCQPTRAATAEKRKARRRSSSFGVQDQFRTRLAYHGVPEIHMKTLVSDPKC